MAINTQKLLPPSSSSAIVKSGKIKINKKSKNNSNNNTINIINAIKKELEKIKENLEKIYNLVLDNNKLTEKDLEVKRLSAEKLKFTEKEKGLETKNPEKKDKESGISIPKLGIFDRINRFITFTLLGWVAVRLVKYLPKLLEFSKNLLPVMEFFSSLTANFFKGVVDFIDFGYSAYDKVKEFVKGIGGESFESAFDGFSDNLNKFINLAIIAGMATMGGTDFGPGKKGGTPPTISKPGQGGRPRVTTSGGSGAGRPDLRNPLRQRPKITGTGGGAAGRPDLRNPLRQKPKITGAGGKVLGKLGGLGGRIPIIGGLVSFIISVMSGEPVGRAAAKAVGFSIGSALGTFVPVPFVGTILGGILGDIVGGALYDTLVSNKPKKPKVVAKSKGGQVSTENQEEKLNIKNSLLQKPKVSTRGGKTVGGVAQRKVKKVVKQNIIHSKSTPIDPGKSVGGKENLKKIFPEPSKDKTIWEKAKTINPYGFTTGTSEKMGKIPFLGPLFNIFGKTLLGDFPNKNDYQKVGVSIGAWINTAINQGKLQGNIVSAFSNGGMIEDIGRSDISGWVEKSVEELVKNKVTEAINELKKNLGIKSEDDKDPDHKGGGAGGGGGGYDDSSHGTPGPPVKATSGFNAGKGDKSRKIFLHWTAWDHNKNFNNYHTTFLGDGKAMRNRPYDVDGTEHTAGANTNSVGLSIAAMKEGKENKFGSFPPTVAQVSAMSLEAARLAVAWGWDESTIDKNVRTHGEWERYATKSGILPGAPQRWDLDKLRQSDPMNSGGDKLRKMIKGYFRKLKSGVNIDSSGKVIVKSSGSALAQMSLETATELVDRVSSGVSVSGGNADFWALAAVASLESGNAQGQADVAQAVYNRVASRSNFGQGSNHTIKGHILARKQFQPVEQTKGSYDIWSKIVDKETAIKALSAHPRGKNAAKMIETAAANIRNPNLRKNSAEWVGGRTDFATPSAANKYPGGFGYKERHGHLYGWYVGPGSIAYGKTNPGPAQTPQLGNITIISGENANNLKFGNQSGNINSAKELGKSMGLNITSMFREGDSGYHGSGRAIDFQTPGKPGNRGTPGQMAYARELIKRYGNTIKELIYTPLGFGIKNGKKVPLTTWGSLSPPWADLPEGHVLRKSTNAIHYDHVHVAFKDGGTIGKIGKNIKSIQTEASYEENQSVIIFIPVLQPVPVPIKGRNRTTFIGGGGSMVNRDTSGFVR